MALSSVPSAAKPASAEEQLRTRVALPTQELGIVGTANYFGRLLTEENSNLQLQSGYGNPGTQEWGAFERMVRTDPHVAMALGFVSAPIRDARIDVEAVDDTPAEQAKADFLRWALQQAEPGWPEFTTQAVDGMLGTGFALFEPVLRGDARHPALPGGRGYSLAKLAQRLPSSINHSNGWLEDEKGELVAVRQLGPAGSQWKQVDVPVDRLLLFSWNRDGNNYAGRSAFRSVYYPVQVRAELMKLIAISYQREGAGVPVAYTDKPEAALTPNQRTDLEKFLANIVYHENANAVMPTAWKLEWLYSPGANKGHIVQAWQDLGLVILQTLQAQQMVLGTNGTGSRSVGEVHFAASQIYVQGVVAALEAVLNGVGQRKYTGLVRRLIDANWGPQEKYPTLRLTLKKSALGAMERFNAVKAGVDAGALHLTLEDENALREELGLSPLDQEELDELEAKKAPPPPVVVPGAPPQQVPPPPPSVPEAPKKMRASFAPRRALRPSEARLDLARMDSFLNSARDHFERLVRPIVAEMLVAVAPDVREAMKDGDPSEVAGIAFDTKRLSAAVASFLEEARTEGRAQVAKELAKGTGPALAEKRAEGDQSLAPVRAAGEEDDKDKPQDEPTSQETDAILEAQRKALVRRMENRLRQELEAEAIDEVRTGGDAGGAVSRTLTRQLDTGAFKSDAGSVLTKAWNLGRDEAARELGGVSTVELSAVLDGRQCTYCDGMDGQQFDFGSAEHDANVPPLRDCDGGAACRCLLVYLPDNSSDDGGDE